MKLVALLGFALVTGCTPAIDPSQTEGPLGATLDGASFSPNGIVARSLTNNEIIIYVFQRPAQCGTAGDRPYPSEHYFQISIPWPIAPGVRVDLRNAAGFAVNTASQLPQGNGGGAKAMNGVVETVSITPTGGIVAVNAANGDGRIYGRVPFTLCPG